MMLTEEDATIVAKRNHPEGKIQKVINYQGKWIFSIFNDDPLEGDMDSFYSVDQTTGDFSGFSIVGDANSSEIIGLFNKVIAHSDPLDVFLEHYGVKGMQWGVRKSEGGGGGNLTTEGNGKPTKFSKNAEATLNVVKPIVGMVIPSANVKGRLINAAVMVAKGAGQVSYQTAMKASFLGPQAIVGYIIGAADSGVYRVPPMVVKNSLRGGWPTNRDLAKVPMSVKEIQSKVMPGVNPQYPGLGTTNNCLRATYTYEMRRRGFDVTATKTMMATGQNAMGTRIMTGKLKVGNKIDASEKFMRGNSKATKIVNAVIKRAPTANDVYHTLSKQPNGSRGDLQMRWGAMGGHSVAYEIVNHKPVVLDTQSGKVYSNPKELNNLVGPATSLKFNRLDDKDLNEMAMTAWIKDADGVAHSQELLDFLNQYIEVDAL